MTICSKRFYLKRGVKDSLLATFDISNLPSGSFIGTTIEWFVKRTLTQSSYNIFKSNVDPSQIEITDVGLGEVSIYMYPEDTQNLQAGDYYWAFKLTHSNLGLLTISPDTSHGELILLGSAVL